MWKGEQLEQETVEPVGFAGQMDVPRFDFGRLYHHAVGFTAVWFLANRVGMPSGGLWSRRSVMPGPAFSIRIVRAPWRAARLAILRLRSGYCRRARKTSIR